MTVDHRTSLNLHGLTDRSFAVKKYFVYHENQANLFYKSKLTSVLISRKSFSCCIEIKHLFKTCEENSFYPFQTYVHIKPDRRWERLQYSKSPKHRKWQYETVNLKIVLIYYCIFKFLLIRDCRPKGLRQDSSNLTNFFGFRSKRG